MNSDSTWEELKASIRKLTGYECKCKIFVTLVKIGYPPILIENVAADTKLIDMPLSDNDSIYLEKNEQLKRRVDEYPVVFVKEMPHDNSCLFHSIGYTLEGKSKSSADRLRESIKPSNFSDSFYSSLRSTNIQCRVLGQTGRRVL